MTTLDELIKNYHCIEGSFIHSLHEKDIFEEDLFWKFYNSILNIAEYYRDKEHDSEITGMIIQPYNYFLKALIWHFSPYDQSHIKNVPNHIHLYLERMSARVESSYFGRKCVDESDFNDELINPFF